MRKPKSGTWIVIAIGACVLYYGYMEYRVGRNASAEPVDVDLAGLEAGAAMPDNHVKIGLHHSLYAHSVYVYEDEDGSGRMNASSPVDCIYTPLISDKHPAMVGLRRLEKAYGGLKKIPRNAKWPKIENFVVILKNERYKKVGDVPTGRKAYSEITGLVINEIDSLSEEEEALIRRQFPNIDFAKVYIVENGRKPTSAGGVIALFLFGGFIVLLPIALLFRKVPYPFAQSDGSEPQQAQPTVAEA